MSADKEDSAQKGKQICLKLFLPKRDCFANKFCRKEKQNDHSTPISLQCSLLSNIRQFAIADKRLNPYHHGQSRLQVVRLEFGKALQNLQKGSGNEHKI